MPKFIDFHPDRKVSDESIERLRKETTEGTYDEFGVRQLELYHNPYGGFYCLLAAPDAEAVRKPPWGWLRRGSASGDAAVGRCLDLDAPV